MCTTGETRYQRRGDTLYKVYPEPKTHQDAQRACAADGGHLVDVKTPALQRFLVEMVSDVNKYRDYWIGLQLEGKRNWKWTDGTDIRDCDYINWAPRHPHPKHPTDCAQLSSSHGFKWKDDGCEQKEYFICQKGPGDNNGCHRRRGNVTLLYFYIRYYNCHEFDTNV
ncbi:PREDICTED: snaclec coagulation factor IX/factor X-binding protein subunit B-like [Branchiostoma belcheri]|uniref:Snaclec coagulation factor IX/factor X-binding protein subunit B-like n=1 Tax=Branchiostoma belcheri TaxID=7741 RepID=A0A6P5A786_BRABE|nr:PREDICTED: snaclec coagulation factor IX/factor X-binding protein subunit B-like [Branchiostoma belcheri]